VSSHNLGTSENPDSECIEEANLLSILCQVTVAFLLIIRKIVKIIMGALPDDWVLLFYIHTYV